MGGWSVCGTVLLLVGNRLSFLTDEEIKPLLLRYQPWFWKIQEFLLCGKGSEGGWESAGEKFGTYIEAGLLYQQLGVHQVHISLLGSFFQKANNDSRTQTVPRILQGCS